MHGEKNRSLSCKVKHFSVWRGRNNVFDVELLWKQCSCCSVTSPAAAIVSNSCKSRLCHGAFIFWLWPLIGNIHEGGRAARAVSSMLVCHWIAQNSSIKCTVQLFDSSDVSSYPRVALEVLNAAVSPISEVSPTPERAQEQLHALLAAQESCF